MGRPAVFRPLPAAAPRRASAIAARGRALTVLALTVLALLGTGHSHAEDASPDDARPAALTALEAGPFRGADLVVVARVMETRDVRTPGGVRGQQLIRARVQETLKGTPPKEEEISVMVLGQRPTLNPDEPSVPYFPTHTRNLYVLFLRREAGRFAYRLQTLFEGSGRVGAEKIAVSRAIAKLSQIGDPDEKGWRTLTALIAMSKGAGRWTKAFAARELNFLARIRPEVFDDRTKAQLRRLPAVTMTADQRFWMQRLFETLAAVQRSGTGGAARAKPGDAESDPWRSTFRAAADPEQQETMLTRLLAGPEDALARHGAWAWMQIEPSLRRWYARAVAESGKKTEKARLRRHYGAEEDPDVRAAIIRTVGLLGEAGDVDWLVSRGRNLTLRRPALLALARIDVPEARRRLEEARAAAETAGEKDLADWIEHLLSPAFAESERRAGRR